MSTQGYQLLPVADVIPSKDNPRRIQKNNPAFMEFCANVKALGVLEPVLVRPHPKLAGKYDLRAGADESDDKKVRWLPAEKVD